MRAFIYCRVSTKEQGSDDHYSLDNQERRCRDYIKMKQWRMSQVRKDIASGKNDEREGFQALLAAIHNRQINVVLVYRLDRLSRNVRDIYDFLDSIKTADVAFVSVTEGFDTTTAMGRAMLGVAAVFAQLTREMIAENTKDGLLRRAEAGHFSGNPSRLYGYDYDKTSGLLVVNAQEAETVRYIFDRFTEHKWGVEKITRALNLRGVPAKTGCQWGAKTVASILRNTVHSGEVRAGKQIVQGLHERIVSPDQFATAQEVISSRSQLPPRAHDSKHLLSGIAQCGTCGKRLRSHIIYSGKEKVPYTFYIHKPTVKAGPYVCPGLAKSAIMLERAVIQHISQLVQSGQLKKLVLKDAGKKLTDERKPKVMQRDKLLLALESLKDTFSRWAERLDAGDIDEEQFVHQNKRLLAQKAKLQDQLSALEHDIDKTERVEVTIEEVRRALENFSGAWDELESEERRDLLRLLIEDLKVFKTHAHLKLVLLDHVELPLTSHR